MVQGQVFLKGGGGGGGWHFSYFLHLEITLPSTMLCYAFKEKKNFLPS